MTLLTNFKKLGVNTAVLATSISLVACGGGGSEGYYDKGSSGSSGNDNSGGNTSTDNSSQVAESISVPELKDASGNVIVHANDSSVVKLSVQVLNKDKGGIAARDVRLSITDNENLNVTSNASVVKTTDSGFAEFELNIPALNASSGKVQLTATVDGTEIKQVYTLNIVKTSTIQSDYNLKIQQGVVLNLPNGSASITAQVTDKNGGVKAGQEIILALPADMQGKFSISSGSALETDKSGNAVFTITASGDLTDDEIQKLAATSQSLDFKLIDEHQAQKSVKAAITFKDLAQVVQKLEIIKADAPIAAQGGTTVVKVRAKNSNDAALANRKVKLIFTDKSDAYGVTLDHAEAITDAKGYASFTLNTNSSYPIALSQQGINLKAIYADNDAVFAQDTISVITTDSNATDELALQRLEIASSYKINAKNDQVTITVKGINNKGDAATKGKVALKLNTEALSNGVTFDGSAEQEFKNGYVTYTLRTNAQTAAAVDALVKAGIIASFKTDNNLSNSIKIAVEDEAKSEEAVGYLAIDPINAAFDYTKDQIIDVKVKAIGVKGSALKGETVSVALPSLTTADLQALGLSLIGQSSTNTDDKGYANFQYQYKVNNASSARQKELLANGIRVLASSSSNPNAQQAVTLNFKAPTDQSDIDLDYLAVDMPGSVELRSGEEHTLQVVVKATGTDGQLYAGQKVAIGLNDAALTNGVVLTTASALATNNSGQAVFGLKVKANNGDELKNLIANGITVAIKGTRKDGSAYTLTRKIDVSTPHVPLLDLAGLAVSYDVQTVSVLGGEVRVKVVAQDTAKNPIANTPLAIALSGLAGSRVSLSDSALTTNSKGEAEFTVKVSEGAYDANLIKNGITFAVVGTNLNNGDRIQQTGTIQVAIPRDSVNLRLTADQENLEFGKTYQVQVAVKDELGTASTGYPVNLSLNSEAIAAGVKLSKDSVVTSENGAVPVSVTIPKNIPAKEKQALLDAGIHIKGVITNPKGEKLESTLSFNVIDAINLNHLNIDSNKISLSTAGDSALVTVKLLDSNQGGIADQPVTLAIVDPRNVTSIKGASQIATNQYGEAVFTLDMKATADANTAPIQLIASHINEQGAIVQQVAQIAVNSPTALAPQLDLKLKASKDKLHVRGDAVDVSVLVTDVNGSSQSGKAVTLTLPDYQRNGAYIRGASTVESDENGWVKFTVVVDESLRNDGYSAAQFVADDLRVEALVKDANGTERRQSYLADVVSAAVPVTQGSITVVMNPTRVGADDPAGVYYNWSASAQVVDLDGRPVANQNVTMDVRAVEFKRGAWTVVEDAVTKEKSWVQYLPSAPAASLAAPLSCAVPAVDDPATPYDDRNLTIHGMHKYDQTLNAYIDVLTLDRDGNQVLETLNTVRFIGASDANPYTATYTTDKEGKFDFQLRYPKAHASWLSVQIGAATTLSSFPIHAYRTVSLPPVADDFDKTNWAYTPSLGNTSPYGTLHACK